jgi:hypothetical protein
MNPTGLRGLLTNPIVGFAPWIAVAVIEGPGRYELAMGVALGVAVLTTAAGPLVQIRPKLLDLVAIVFFAAMLVAGQVVGPAGRGWLELWSGELASAVLVLIALASIVARRPFTLQYARETTPREYWRSPLFLHINYVITWVWTAAFAVIVAVGWYGDGPLHQPDNAWTNWIIPIAALVVAIRFTQWYPGVARSRERRPEGTS